ncbi:MAG: DUF3467 domain-containing protein [Thermoanaerobaculia bacterium]|nr:DUF3467 domain-containing protein [Thermoanaerobaculia bacterium]
MSQQKKQQLQVVIDDSVSQGKYVNFANIIHSPSEFVIDLGRIVPGKNDVRIQERIIMTPLHAKQFLQALAKNINMYEEKFGAIRMDFGQATPQHGFEPSEPN